MRHHALAHDTIAIVVAIATGHPDMIVLTHVACKVVAVAIEAIVIVNAVVSTGIDVIDAGKPIVEVVAVVVTLVYAEDEVRAGVIDGTVEILPPHEFLELTATQHIAQVLVAEVEQIVVVIDCIVVAVDHVVDHLVDIPEEVVVDFIDIDPLFVREPQFVTHPVGQEPGFATDLHGAEHCARIQTDGCQDHHH